MNILWWNFVKFTVSVVQHQKWLNNLLGSQCPFHLEPIWVISFSPYQMFHPMPCRVVEGGVVLVSLGTNNVFFCSIVSILFHEFLVNMPLDAKVHLSIADVWIKLTAKFPWALVHLGGRFFYRIRGTDIIMKTYILVSIYLFILQFLTGGYNRYACIIWFPFSCM